MARSTPQENRQHILDTVSAAGGTITYADLVTNLETAGRRDALIEVANMNRAGQIVPILKVNEDGSKPVLKYTLPTAE